MLKRKQAPKHAAQRGISWRDKLAAVPRHNDAADVSLDEAGLVQVTVAHVRPRWLVPPLTSIIRLTPSRTWKLDRMGSEIWKLCDGRPMEDVIDAFARAYDLTFHEARVAVMQYMTTLVRRGLLGIVQELEEG